MSIVFQPLNAGGLQLRNRLMRSATAERLADAQTGAPLPRLGALYRTLAEGGVGLIVTGHAYVHPTGKAHPEMAGIYDDALIPFWREAVKGAQETGARVVMQINHSGASCDPQVNAAPFSPSGVPTNELVKNLAVATEEQIQLAILAFGQAARRAREAGLDGVQVHGAHGYLVSQFLMPRTNHRDDRWGGDANRRANFLRAVVAEIRKQVGADYPVWIKLGVAGDAASGLTIAEGAQVALECKHAGLGSIEISMAWGSPEELDFKREAIFTPLANAVRQAVGPTYPLALVNSIRSLGVMEGLLESEVVQLISLCRPLISEPDLPAKLHDGRTTRATCLSCDRCWPKGPGEGIACKNAKVKKAVSGQ